MRENTQLVTASDVAAAVPMVTLLEHLGVDVNTRTNRAACVIHGGDNPTSFSWNEEFFHCFSCGEGGDKVQLVQSVRRCSFKEALGFIADLGGIKLDSRPRARREFKRLARERQKAAREKAKLESIKKQAANIYADRLDTIRRVRRQAGKRIAAIRGGGQKRWSGEEDAAWEVLAALANEERYVDAGFSILAFASEADRERFVFNRNERVAMTESMLLQGYVENEKEHRITL